MENIFSKTTAKQDIIEALLKQAFWKDTIRSAPDSSIDFGEVVENAMNSSEGMEAAAQEAHVNDAMNNAYRQATESWFDAHESQLRALI